MTANEYIHYLQLQPHPEGGYYRQTYCSSECIPVTALPPRFNGDRYFSTAIYYLLAKNDFSAFHKIKSDECWHFYTGDSLYIHVIDTAGDYHLIKLGTNIRNEEVFQYIVPAEAWFAVEPGPEASFALAGCTVAPGFNFEDFEMATKESLAELFPQHYAVINRLCKE
jgi:predicted cupin superfamily sugar epimerase